MRDALSLRLARRHGLDPVSRDPLIALVIIDLEGSTSTPMSDSRLDGEELDSCFQMKGRREACTRHDVASSSS